MTALKELIKKILPKSWILAYHYLLAQLAAIVYWFPSKKMIVIGVTGTNGKSTTVNLIARILEESGSKVGIISTVNFQIAGNEWLNNLKMTMPGRFRLQKMLRQMVRADCKYVVIETSSEGILQYRHLGVEYDVGVFTNLTPEHLHAHGGFDNYKKTKLKLPASVAGRPAKKIHSEYIKRILAANLDDRHAPDFLDFDVDEKHGYTTEIRNTKYEIPNTDITELNNFGITRGGIRFNVRNVEFSLKLLGLFDLYNAGTAISVTQALGVELETAKSALEKVEGIPGRMEKIQAGQPFTVVVDYSPEPTSLSQVYKTLEHWEKNQIIHVLGSAGGGRDTSRRPILGYIAGSNADYVVVTNEDPYDDDPQEIINDVAVGAVEAGLTQDEELFKILDRREAIRKALQLAKENDLVLLTGKGAEQAMVVAKGKKIPWDDREVVREELVKLGFSK